MTGADRAAILAAMRVPLVAFAVLLGGLALIVLLGQAMPGRVASFLEVGIVLGMIATVLLFTMEVRHEAALIKIFSVLGFFWLCILGGMTMIDYLTR